MMKLLLVCLAFGIVSACDQAPGTTVTTVTTTTRTVTSDDGEGSLINSADRSVIRRTWEMAKKDGDVAPQILLRFLKAHPEYQKKFRTFANVPQDELLHNGSFLAQAFTILGGLNTVIQSMGSNDLLAQEVQQLGAAHKERGVTPNMFEEFSAVVVEVLDDELGSVMDDKAKQAWKNGLRALSAGIAKNLKDKQDLAHPVTHLTPRQVHDVQSSWQRIRDGRNALVTDIFQKLFRESPRTQRAFAKFSSVAIDALPGNADFNKQVALVADRLDNMIATADDTLQIVGQLNYMAYSHKDRSIGRQAFEDFGRILLEDLAGKGVSANEMDSWRGTLRVLVESIDKIQKQQ